MKLLKELLTENEKINKLKSAVREIINDGIYYDSNDKEQKGVTFEDLKYFLKGQGIKRVPSGTAFQSALRQAGLNIRVESGKRQKGKGKSLNFWRIK